MLKNVESFNIKDNLFISISLTVPLITKSCTDRTNKIEQSLLVTQSL